MISIIISTYNRANGLLQRTLDSIRSQTYQNFKVIIVDDCSTDNTSEVVREYKEKMNIQYIRLDENSGSDTKPKNIGVMNAKTKLVCFVDDDVVLRKNHLLELVRAMREENVDVVYSDMWIMPNDEPGIARDFDAQFLMLRNFIDTSSALIKRKAIIDVGGFDETLPKYIDWNLWVRMTKAGKKFKRVPTVTFDYYIHKDTKSNRIPTETYIHPKLGQLFVPTFDPSGCKIHVGNLGEEYKPKVAIFTIHYNRKEYSLKSMEEMFETAGYPFDWYCWDNGNDGTYDALSKKPFLIGKSASNIGITGASNRLLDSMKNKKYDIIIKIDNDVEFYTYDWLKDIVDLWQRNRMIYVSPYVEGLKHNPGGARRVGFGMIGENFVEVTNHIGGIFCAISSMAYEDFRWTDEYLHGDQDVEASMNFREKGYMPCYFPKHIIAHRDGTDGQHKKYEEYFEKRKDEKTTII